MPSTEYIQDKKAHPNVGLAVQDLKVFLLYSCPVCRRYTIHGPRFSSKGYCYVDHRREPEYQMNIDGSEHLTGIVAVDFCYVAGNHPAANIETTRTVIRVK